MMLHSRDFLRHLGSRIQILWSTQLGTPEVSVTALFFVVQIVQFVLGDFSRSLKVGIQITLL